MWNKKVGGKRHFFINGVEYELTDPDDFLERMLTMEERFYPRNWVKLFTMALVGSMGSGKTTIINKIVNSIVKAYGDEVRAIKTDDLVYALKKGLDLSYFQIVIIDDAMQSGYDSRRSMSNENIDMSQSFSIGRHIAKKTMKAGILFVIFAIQSPTRLDKFIRENCDLTIYKTYYPFLEKIAPPEEVKFVKDFTKEAMLENNLDKLSACLGIDRINRCIQFNFPMEKPVIDIIEVKKEEDDYEPIIEILNRIYNEDWNDKKLQAYIYNWSKKNEITLNNAQIKDICYRVIYNFEFGCSDTPKPKIDYRDVLIENEILGIKWDDLARKYAMPRTTLYDNCNRYKNRVLTQMQ
jgi:GTPase SAR1 family protein